MNKRWRVWLGVAVVAVPVTAAAAWLGLLALALGETPLVAERPALTLAEMGRAKQLLHDAWDPQAPASLRTLAVTSTDVDVLWQETALRLLKGAGRFGTSEGAATAVLSLRVQDLPVQLPRPWGMALISQWRPWLNVGVGWTQTPAGMPDVVALRVGSVPVPVWAMHAALPLLKARWPMLEPVTVLTSQVRQVALTRKLTRQVDTANL